MNLVYNFTFAELVIKFLETANIEYLNKISELDATDHIFNHALRFNSDIPTDSRLEFVTNLLTPIDKYEESLPYIIRNIKYAKEYVANHNIVEKTALESLPEGFSFSGSLFFTIGYDIGVAFGNNCSLNLAHPIFLKRGMNELKYYAIHELHHTGFITLKGFMPSFEISNRREMACIIEYLTHLEGMGTYAALNIRGQEGAMNTNYDYISLQDQNLLDCLIKEYFDIYRYFKDNPDEILCDEDWQKIGILSDVKRLWYVVGAHIARTIDYRKGKAYLTKLISEPSENFIKAFIDFE